MKSGWIGVELDATLARYEDWSDPDHLGEPVAPMVERVRSWFRRGIEVRIFTARACRASAEDIARIEDWAEERIGHRLRVTCSKDYGMIQFWDDRAVSVAPNDGLPRLPEFI